MASKKTAGRTPAAQSNPTERSVVMLESVDGVGEKGKIVRVAWDDGQKLFDDKKARAATTADFGFSGAAA